jgi:DNA-binding transcriptional regulator LsrR (DeoR family)
MAATEPIPTPKLLYDRKAIAHALSISERSVDYLLASLIASQKVRIRYMGRKPMIHHDDMVKLADQDFIDIK